MESEIETKSVDHAKVQGFIAWKFTCPGRRGVPDRIFLQAGHVFFIEFKDTGKKERKQQALVRRLLQAAGFTVYTNIDSVEKGKECIDAELEKIRLR